MRIGIDLGGTKIEGVALGDDGARALRRRIPSPRGDYGNTLDAVAGLVRDIEREVGRAAAPSASGFPASISPATGLVKNANSTWLIGKPLGDDLPRCSAGRCASRTTPTASRCRKRPTAPAPARAVVFGVIIGTGCGGGLVVNGRVLAGANAIARRVGTQPAAGAADDERPGPACYCGRHGCIETFLSGPALARDYLAGGVRRRTRRAERSRRARRGGDALAMRAMERYEDRLARALGSVINIARSRRHRARRRPVEHRSPVYERCRALGAVRLFRSRRHASGARGTRRFERRARRGVAVGGAIAPAHVVPRRSQRSQRESEMFSARSAVSAVSRELSELRGFDIAPCARTEES